MSQSEKADKDKDGWYPGKYLGKKRNDEESDFTGGSLNAFMGKFSSEHRNDLSELHGCMWEADASVTICRQCSTEFGLVRRKHHCRACGGIFCEGCCKEILKDRVCDGCRCGEAAGEKVKQIATRNCNESGNVNGTTTVAGALTVPPILLKLHPGTLFPEDDDENVVPRASLASAANMVKDPVTNTLIPPSSGYFELINKSETELCCVKVLLPGNHNLVYEAPRPSYICVPPGECVHVSFIPETAYLDVLVLFENPFPLPANRQVVYDTTPVNGRPVENISPCAETMNFEQFMIYRIPCRGNNVLLKYKGGDSLELRLGTSIARVGIFSSLLGSNKAKKATNQYLNMSTNAQTLTLICNSKI